MSADHDGVRELIGAWALGAAPAADEPRILAHLAECRSCTAEARRLREVVHALDGAPDHGGHPRAAGAPEGAQADGSAPAGETVHAPEPAPAGETAHADEPGPARRAPLLAAALRTRRVTRVAAHAAPYAAAVSGLEALLREVASGAGEEAGDDDRGRRGGDIWRTPVVHDWDVHATLAHLIAADEPLARHLGLPTSARPAATADTEILAGRGWREAWARRSAEVIAYEHRHAPGDTLARWRRQTGALLAAPAAHDPELAARATTLLGARLPVADHYLVRAFETWVHTDDIGRALGRSVPPPPDPLLWQLVRLAVRILGLALGSGAPPVLLTVAGAGDETEWVLGSEADPVAAELVLDPVDFCLLVGGRQDPAQVPRGLAGDPGVARGVLDRAAALAWL
ncbi:maleylpyruvate isomerase family mycothiol-dependent enzyme [Streptomyces monticola]|uniref:Maleylpyruvate isomerase family mycothiol-dependent enzyme n=1 Tax=Streptomyces monticola TaxID=2666263 RepID=A0ABW2JKK1_9ACTN